MISVDTDFDNGGARLVCVDEVKQEVTLTPLGVNGERPLFIHARIDGLTRGRPLVVRFADVHVNGGHCNPVFSVDGAKWERMVGEGGVYRADAGADSVFVARNIPYPYGRAVRLAQGCGGSTVCSVSDLCVSEEGRPVKLLKFARPSAGAARKSLVWVQARQHAFESHGSHVTEGIAAWVMAGGELQDALLERAVVCTVPIMDVDGVFHGRSGKDQHPVDFNRDWSARPHWNAVSAAIATLDELTEDMPLPVFLDVHDPWFPEGNHLHVPGTTGRDAAVAFGRRFESAVQALATENSWRGEFRIGSLDGMAGVAANVALERWMSDVPGAVALSLEVAHWRDADGRFITEEGLRGYGAALGGACAKMLSDD